MFLITKSMMVCVCYGTAQTIFCFINLKLRVMSKHFEKVLKALKTSDEVKALGFDKDEIKRLASNIDKKLNLEDDASDEDVESAIDEAVENAIPYLKMAQSSASRIVKKKLAKSKKDEDDDEDEDDDDDTVDDDDDEDDDDEPKGKSKKSKKSKKNRQTKSDDDDDVKSLLKTLLKKVEKQDETIANLRKGNTEDKRRSKLEKLLKDTGSFGKRYLRQFDKMNFEDDDEFEEFLEEVKDDLEETNQERANAGLDKLGIKVAPTSRKDDEDEQTEVVTDDELDALADQL